MKKRKEFSLLKKCCKFLEDMEYPGYPFSRFGIVDFKTKDCWVNNKRDSFVTDPNFEKFGLLFQSGLLYNILDTNFTRKGSFVTNSHMEHYKTFLQEKWQDPNGDDQFYIDNQELVRLYFAVYAAIREYKDTNKIMLYIYDGDAGYVDVLLFDTLDEINKYYKDYVKGE